MKTWIDRLRRDHQLPIEVYRELLTCQDAEILEYLHLQAREVAMAHFGNKIFIRGLIEISNCCRNDCLYCGFRKSNIHVDRFRLSNMQIFACFH